MNNNNDANDINSQDVYTDNPELGRSRERVEGQASDTVSAPDQRRSESSMSGSIRDRALQNSANERGQGSISSGQQSSTSSDSSISYSTPESRFGQNAQGGNTQPESGYNQSTYNQSGTYSQSQGDSGLDMNGLQDTQGSGYGQGQGNPRNAERGYDPAQSGTRPAQNTPGESVDTPGRETGTAWGEDQQMGLTTDTSDRSNPAV